MVIAKYILKEYSKFKPYISLEFIMYE